MPLEDQRRRRLRNRMLQQAMFKSADREVIPAIVACQFSVCLIIFGVFLLISGAMFPAVSAGPTSIVGGILLTVGTLLTVAAIAAFAFAAHTYINHENKKRQGFRNPEAGVGGDIVNPAPLQPTTPANVLPPGSYPVQQMPAHSVQPDVHGVPVEPVGADDKPPTYEQLGPSYTQPASA